MTDREMGAMLTNDIYRHEGEGHHGRKLHAGDPRNDETQIAVES